MTADLLPAEPGAALDQVDPVEYMALARYKDFRRRGLDTSAQLADDENLRIARFRRRAG